MILVYEGLTSGDVVELPFHGNVKIENIDWGRGGENCIKKTTNIDPICTYNSKVQSRETRIVVNGKAN